MYIFSVQHVNICSCKETQPVRASRESCSAQSSPYSGEGVCLLLQQLHQRTEGCLLENMKINHTLNSDRFGSVPCLLHSCYC